MRHHSLFRKKYLTTIDCGPGRFAIWRMIPDETVNSVIQNFNQIFLERGPPWELLLDNGPVFRSEEMKRFCISWGVKLRFRCVNRPAGNGIVERHHRTVKRMAARSGRDILEMVMWYNIAPKSGVKSESIPYRSIYKYDWKPSNLILEQDHRQGEAPFRLGQKVFIKPAAPRCTTRWNDGTVTGSGDGVTIEVNGMPRHIADVRTNPAEDVDESIAPSRCEGVVERIAGKPQRERRLPRHLHDYAM
jgi:hypothetical protein